MDETCWKRGESSVEFCQEEVAGPSSRGQDADAGEKGRGRIRSWSWEGRQDHIEQCLIGQAKKKGITLQKSMRRWWQDRDRHKRIREGPTESGDNSGRCIRW